MVFKVMDIVTYRLYDEPQRCGSELLDAVSGALLEVQATYTGLSLQHVNDHGRPAVLITVKGIDHEEWHELYDIQFRRRVGDAIAGVRFHILP